MQTATAATTFDVNLLKKRRKKQRAKKRRPKNDKKMFIKWNYGPPVVCVILMWCRFV